jgi:ribosomal protein S18 acetylase RimI-like enzyme
MLPPRTMAAAPLVRRMTDADLAAVTAVFLGAFPDKTTAALRQDPPLVARLFAEAALAGGDAWVADRGDDGVPDRDDGVAGVVTFQDRQRPFLGHIDLSPLRSVRPLRRGLRVTAFLAMFHTVTFPASELYLETLAVRPDVSGKGIGGALLRFADDEARRRSRTSLSLYCIRGNERARALYVRHGYRTVRCEDLWWCSGLLGFRFTDQLRRELPHASSG